MKWYTDRLLFKLILYMHDEYNRNVKIENHQIFSAHSFCSVQHFVGPHLFSTNFTYFQLNLGPPFRCKFIHDPHSPPPPPIWGTNVLWNMPLFLFAVPLLENDECFLISKGLSCSNRVGGASKKVVIWLWSKIYRIQLNAGYWRPALVQKAISLVL